MFNATAVLGEDILLMDETEEEMDDMPVGDGEDDDDMMPIGDDVASDDEDEEEE